MLSSSSGSVLPLLVAALLWGVTNPYLKHFSKGMPVHSSTLDDLRFLLSRPLYLLVQLLNLCGSLAFFLGLREVNVSVGSIVTNALAFVITTFVSLCVLKEGTLHRRTALGCACVLLGTSLCTLARYVAVLVVLVLFSVGPTLTAAAEDCGTLQATVKMIQVVHRHGARTPEATYNQSFFCASLPCGALTLNGAKMLNSVGAFVRTRYNSKDPCISLTPLFPDSTYKASQIYSRSTDSQRTLQSAAAFLHGLFPDDAQLNPAIHTVPATDDVLLNFDFQPVPNFIYMFNKTLLREIGNPATDANFPTLASLLSVAKLMHSEGFCSNHDSRSDCTNFLYEVAAWMRSEGTAAEGDAVVTSLPKFAATIRAQFIAEFGYKHDDPQLYAMGSAGQPFLQQVLQNIHRFRDNTDATLMYHYSAHDYTLSAISSALLDMSDDAVLPPYGQMLIFELLQDNAKPEQYHVRVLRGMPGQEPNTLSSFSLDQGWQLRCVSAPGVVYRADHNACPLEDFQRMVNYSLPGDPMGSCHLTSQVAALDDCPAGGIMSGQTGLYLSPSCMYYRRHCPDYACDSGYTLNAQTLQCLCSSKTCLTKDSRVSAGATAGIAVATFCVGVIVTAIVLTLVCLRRQRAMVTQTADKYVENE